MKNFSKIAGFGLVISMLAGCSSMNVFKDSPSAPPPSAKVEAPVAPQPKLALDEPLDQPSVIPAAQIRKIVAGKSFRWQGPNNSGTTLFAQDGTSLLEVDGKGTAAGKWVAKDGQLCESVAPGSLLPNGSPLKCNSFSGSNGQYKVGPVNFTAS